LVKYMRRRKNKKQIRIIISLSICLLLIMTVGYAAFNTNLSINAKGNIKDYNAAWQLKKKVITSGDGLYKDNYEDERYIYRGQEPNNYIVFNDELWQIIAIEEDDALKIIKKDSVNSIAWDLATNRNNDNNTYCNRIYTFNDKEQYLGCNVWSAQPGNFTDGQNQGTVSTDASLNTYLNTEYYEGLKDKEYIISHSYNIGKVISSNDPKIADIYKQEKLNTWTGKVGLFTISDFLKASTNENCNSINNSRSITETPCALENGNYLDAIKKETWTMIPYNATSSINAAATAYVRTVGAYLGNGIKGGVSGYPVITAYQVRPVVHLKPEIKLIGSGTKDDPYVIK
jgi:hypothetical protein